MKQYQIYRINMSTVSADAAAEVTFTHENGKTLVVKAFVSGKNELRAHFLPDKPGTYTYVIKGKGLSSDTIREGSISCEPADAGSHGIVRAEGKHFRYDDKTWYNPFGTTVYALVHQPADLIEQTMQSLSESPFNKIRMCLFPKHYDFNHNEPECFAFEKNEEGKFDVTRPHFRFWTMLEENIERLGKMGIECDLILFHPYDRWGFADMSLEEAKTYLDYTIRRLAAFPNIWWSLANEYDLMKYNMDEWEEIARFVAEADPYHHLLSNHNCIAFWDFNNKDTSHICLQIKSCEEISGFIRRYQKPLIVDECCYEGNIAYEWGNSSAFALVSKFWMAVVQGGYCTHGETFICDIDSYIEGNDEDEILWWSRGGLLKGESSARIAYLKSIIDELNEPLTYCGYEFSKERYDEINANPSCAENDFWRAVASVPWERAKGAMLTGKEYVGKSGEDVYIKYLETKCAAVTDLNLPEEYKYDVYLIDVWNMTKEKIMTLVNGSIKVKLPGKVGMALMARRV